MEGSPAIPTTEPRPPRFSAGEASGWACADLPGATRKRITAKGPFTALAEPPENAWAWYVNDFALSSPRPWRVPQGGIREDAPASSAGGFPAVKWDAAGKAEYCQVFEEAMRLIDGRALLKAVPVSVRRGRLAGRVTPAAVAGALERSREGGMGHGLAWAEEDSGFAAITPEVLFRVEGRRLTTMALAGTADAAHENDLRQRPKLAREHEIVVDELHRRLATLGPVDITAREVATFGNVRHLRTRLTVELPEEPDGAALNGLVRLLHPTPALGVSPRSPRTLDLLRDWRARCGVPSTFGAPFGVRWPGGAVFLVVIRGIFWQNGEVCLPAGGGLVAGSELEPEWEEQELKRAWVRHAFGLA